MKTTNASLIFSSCSTAVHSAAALGLALQSESGAPEWVQLLPAGPVIAGRDGRAWTLSDPQTVINAYRANKGPIAIDWEHAQDRLAAKGMDAPASGWIEDMEVRSGEIWARVTWVPRAAQAIAAREYRFLSPTFTHTKDGKVIAIVGAGLVNRPNFVMAALNANLNTGEMIVDKIALCAALGLAATATDAEIITAVNALKAKAETALNNQQPSLNDFVPRAEYDVAINRATTAENLISSEKKARLEAEISAAVDDAIKTGKIAPASKDYFLSTCRADDGLEQFKKFVSAQPSQFTPGVDPAKKQEQQTALNAEERNVAATLGLTEAEYLAAKSA